MGARGLTSSRLARRAACALEEALVRAAPVLGLIALAGPLFPVSSFAEENVVLHDTTVVLDSGLVIGAEASAFVTVQGSTDLDETHPMKGAEVSLSLVRGEDKTLKLARIEREV